MRIAITPLFLALSIALSAALPADAAIKKSSKTKTGTPAETAKVEKSPVVLNSHLLLNGEFIRLGDLFDNIDEAKADINVAYAPDPGKRATFDARWLYRVARAYELDWRPFSKLDQAVVERDSITVDREEIEEMIQTALEDRGLDSDMQVMVSNRMLRVHLPADSNGLIEVDDVTYDERANRFSAYIIAPAGSPKAERTRVSGKVHRMIEVPALTRQVPRDEIIGARDIQWLKFRAARVQDDVIRDPEDLIGLTPKRSLRPGKPIRTADVRRPILVPKNGLVTMILQVPNMTLSAQGKALDNGSDGDVVRISNSKSRTVVEGVVVGANRVAVRPTGQMLLN